MSLKNDEWLRVAYTKYLDFLIVYLRRFVSSSHPTENLAHDTSLRVYASENLDNIREPQSYLFRIVRNTALNLNNLYCITKKDAAAEVTDIVDEEASVEHQAITAQDYATIRKVMNRVPERRQQVLVLNAFFEFSGQE